MDTFQFLAAPLALSILLVGMHAYLGMHVLERGVIFVDISLSQVAALGAVLSQLFFAGGENPLSIGFSLGLCLVVSGGLALLRTYETKIAQEAIVGVTYALASGVLILVMDKLPHGAEHLKTALVGNILFITWPHVVETLLIYAVIGLIHFKYRKQFWQQSRGERKSIFWDFAFYFLFGVVITFSTHHAGVLVVFSILIVPSALATKFMIGTRQRLLFAWTFGVIAMFAAFLLGLNFDWPAGAGIVTTLSVVFL